MSTSAPRFASRFTTRGLLRSKVSRAALLATVGVLAVPAAASAAGNVTVTGNELTFVDALGSNADIDIAPASTPGSYVFRNQAAGGVSASSGGCTPTASAGGTLPGAASERLVCVGVTSIRLLLDNGNDSAVAAANVDVPITALGQAGTDRLTGGSAADTLEGGDGQDLLSGNDGSDTLRGGDADDVLVGGAGDDQLFGNEGNDGFSAGLGDDVIDGGNGNDRNASVPGIALYGIANNTPVSDANQAGNDRFVERADDGADNWIGGAGFDTADYSAYAFFQPATLNANGLPSSGRTGAPTDTLGRDIESLTGGDGDDTLVPNVPEAPNNLTNGGVFDGRGGTDTIDFQARNTSVQVSLDNVANDGGTTTLPTPTVITENLNVRDTVERVIGSTQNDTLTGSSSNNTLDGRGGNDTISGLGGDDALLGGTGNDSLDGGGGDDQLDVDGSAVPNGQDVLVGGDGTDAVSYAGRGGADIVVQQRDGVANDGAAGEFDNVAADVENLTTADGNDTVVASDVVNRIETAGGNDTISAGGGDDTILSGSGDDTVAGEAGNDSITTADGFDTVTGGADDDTIDVGDGGSAVNAGAGDDSVQGGLGNDAINGDDGNDVLRGAQSDDTLRGGAGDDDLYGGVGNDQVFGDAGDDDVFEESAANGFDVLQGGADNDRIDYSGRSGGVNVSFDGIQNDGESGEFDNVAADFEVIDTGSGSDSVSTDDDAEVIRTRGGNDGISARGGGDTIDAGDGSDSVSGGDGDDTFVANDAATNSSDTYAGDGGSDTVDYTGRGDALRIVLGTNDNGFITGGTPENDTLLVENATGGAGADEITGDAGANVLRGGGGADEIDGAAGNDQLFGGTGADSIDGGAGQDAINGDSGSDNIQIRDGENDTVDGGAGTDTVIADALPLDPDAGITQAEVVNRTTGGGAQGPQGDPGPAGPAGPQGPQGVPGADGAPGAPGTNGADGAPGAPGTNGTNGTNGAQGPAGTNGTNGQNGAQGPAGPAGPLGPVGPSGANGTNGVKGDKGDKGDTGSRGANGFSTQLTTARVAGGRVVTVRVLVAGKRASRRTVTIRVGTRTIKKTTTTKGVATFKVASRGSVKVISVK